MSEVLLRGTPGWCSIYGKYGIPVIFDRCLDRFMHIDYTPQVSLSLATVNAASWNDVYQLF